MSPHRPIYSVGSSVTASGGSQPSGSMSSTFVLAGPPPSSSASNATSSASYPSYARPALLARQQPSTEYPTPATTSRELQQPSREYAANPRYNYQPYASAGHAHQDSTTGPSRDGRSLPTSSPTPTMSSEDSDRSSSRLADQTAPAGEAAGSSGGGSTGQPSSAAAAKGNSGRKRKRLQRACVPCHKAKRRCDGGLPCSNCDFSGRSCSYADSHGNAVQPTARAKPPVRNDGWRGQAVEGEADGLLSDTSKVGSSTWQQASPSTAATSVSYSRPSLPVTDPRISDHLRVFRDSVPVNALLPKVFYSKAQPGTILTLAISCFASSRSSGDIFAGDVYAHSARKLVIDEDESRLSVLERPTVETALTTLLLTLHEAGTGKMVKAVSASRVNLTMVQELRLHEGTGSAEHFLPAEIARLVCLVYVTDLVICTLAARPTSLSDTDFLIATARLAYVAGGDATTGAFLALLRSARVFAAVVDHQRRHTYRLLSVDEMNDTRRKDSLNVWADSLPPSLAFNDGNLAEVSRILSGHSSHQQPALRQQTEDETAWAWAWGMMHCFAEMSVFLLECLPSGSTARREAASANLGVLTEALNKESVSGTLGILPLLFASQARSVDGTPVAATLHIAEAQKSLCLIDDEQLRRSLAYLGITDPIPTMSRHVISSLRAPSNPSRADVPGPTNSSAKIPLSSSTSPLPVTASKSRVLAPRPVSSQSVPREDSCRTSASSATSLDHLAPVNKAGPQYTHSGYSPLLLPPPPPPPAPRRIGAGGWGDRRGGPLTYSDLRTLPPLGTSSPTIRGGSGSGGISSPPKNWMLK